MNGIKKISCRHNLLLWIKIEFFLDRIITGNKKWVIYNNIKDSGLIKTTISTRSESKPWKKDFMVCMVKLSRYNSLRVFEDKFNDYCGYIQQLQRIKEKFYEKRPALVNQKNIILLIMTMHDHMQQGQFKKKFLNLISFTTALLSGSYVNRLSPFLPCKIF